jgi:hypothetical protein
MQRRAAHAPEYSPCSGVQPMPCAGAPFMRRCAVHVRRAASGRVAVPGRRAPARRKAATHSLAPLRCVTAIAQQKDCTRLKPKGAAGPYSHPKTREATMISFKFDTTSPVTMPGRGPRTPGYSLSRAIDESLKTVVSPEHGSICSDNQPSRPGRRLCPSSETQIYSLEPS